MRSWPRASVAADMTARLWAFGQWLVVVGRALSMLLFATVLGALLLVVAAAISPGEVVAWALRSLGLGYLALLLVLVLGALIALTRLRDAESVEDLHLWRDAGLHAASAIATMALTWTLLGISLGIGTLAETELSPGTVQSVIAELTKHFSMAFLTTVIGLPVATALRALISVAAADRRRHLSKPGITLAEYGTIARPAPPAKPDRAHGLAPLARQAAPIKEW